MSNFGVTLAGFNRKRLDQLLAEMDTEIKSIFGNDFNTSPESPDGQVIGVISESNANLWELLEACYNAFNPSAATGKSLSDLVQLNSITRQAPTASTVVLNATGTASTVVPAGSSVSTLDSSATFITDTVLTIDSSGLGSVSATAVTTGPLVALAGTITNIDTPVAGWSTVTNSSNAVIGSNEETDVELRARRRKSIGRASLALIDSIFAEVSAVVGVDQLVILENDTNATDANGLPAHSFHTIIVGGDNTEIATAIFVKKPPGVLSFGSTTVAINDKQGIPHNISFSRPTEISIYIEVTLTTSTEFPVNGSDQIKQAIVDYANGDLVTGRGFSLGNDVIFTRLYTPINSVAGHEIDTLYIGVTPTPTATNNIVIGVDEVSKFTVANINVIMAP